MQTQGSPQWSGDDLVQDRVVALRRAPELESVRHLRDEKILDEGSGDEWARGKVAGVDAGDEISGYLGLGDNGVKLVVPPAVGLKDQPKVFVVVHYFYVVGVKCDGGGREMRRLFVGYEQKLRLGDGEFQPPFGAPFFDVGNEPANNVVLGDVRLPAAWLGPS